MSLLGLFITLRTDPKSSPGPTHAMSGICLFFSFYCVLLWSLSPCQNGLVNQKALSSRSLSLHCSFIVRKVLVPSFGSFTSLGILPFPDHTDMKYSSEELLHLLCFPLCAHNYLFLCIHLTSASYPTISPVWAITASVWKGLKNYRLDETKII